MKRAVVDYSGFRLDKLRHPRFSHLLLLLGWVGYLLLYVLTEALIPAERCIPVHTVIDDWIPFCEVFVIPYVLWYFLIAGSLLYFLLYDVDSFRSLQTFFIITQLVAIIAYILLPTRQDLRPAVFPRDNLLTRCVGFLYCVDTNTGVCPSLHAALSVAMASVWLKAKQIPVWWKGCVVILAVLICLSTMFIKQHSAVDVLAALPVCLLAEILVFGPYWKRKMKNGSR